MFFHGTRTNKIYFVLLLNIFWSLYSSLSRLRFCMIFGLINLWCIVGFYSSTLYVNIILKTVTNNQNYCFVVQFTICLKAVCIKLIFRDTMSTPKFDKRLSCLC